MAKYNKLRLLAAASALVIILLSFACAAGATTALKLKVPWDHEYLYWARALNTMFMDGHVKTHRLGEPQPSTPASAMGDMVPQRFKGKTATLELPDLSAGMVIMLTVYDTTTGNEAVETVKIPVGPKGLTLQKRDFDEVRRVRIKITADHGKPVESALVTLKDISGRTATAMVDPTTAGIAEFLDVTAGDATITVLYGDGKKTSQTIDIAEERDEPVFTTEVPVAGPVATIEEPKAGEQTAPAEKEKSGRSRTGWAATMLGSMVGFTILVIIVVGAVYYLKSKGMTVEGSLKKVGVALPEYEPEETTPAPAAPEVDPNICPFCGQRKDANGQCACTVSAQPAPPGAAPGASTGPRLVGSQGAYAANIFELTSDVTTIGRELDNTVPLPADTTVSRHHARIALENGEYVAYDAGSSNGVFVNGEKISQRALHPGDEVQIGSTKFRFES